MTGLGVGLTFTIALAAFRVVASEGAVWGPFILVPVVLGFILGFISPGVLAILASREPGAVRWSSNDSDETSTAIFASTLEWERLVDAARATDILDTIRRHVGEPVKRGRAWLVSCPFHEDAKPSVSIDPAKGVWYCFPCAVGGDGIELVMRLHRLDFAEAVRELAA